MHVLTGDICCTVLGVHGALRPAGAWVSPASLTASSAHGAAGDGTIPGKMCPPGGPDPAQNLLESPTKGISPCPGEMLRWRQVVESNMAREEEG